MIPLIRIGEPVIVALVPGPAFVVTPRGIEPTDDPEEAFRLARAQGWSDELAAVYAAHAIGLEVVDGEGDTLRWTISQVRHLIFLRQRDDRGEFTS